MSKNYINSLKIALVAILSFYGLAANAADPTNKWFYVAAKAYPSGSGSVYVVNQMAEGDPETFEYKELSETYYHDATGYEATFDFFAKPAEGRKFIGWATVNTDDDGNETLSDLVSTANPMNVWVDAKTDTGDDDGSTGIEPYPLFPDTTFAAVFGYVDYQFVPGQGGYDGFGKVEIKNPAAAIGEQVTFTATPKDSTCTFIKWTDAKGKEYTDNPLTLTVDGANTITPHFECTASIQYTFPEDGAIRISAYNLECRAGAAYEAGALKAYSFYDECWQKDEEGKRINDYVSNKPGEKGYTYMIRRGEGFLMWGQGTFNITFEDYPEAFKDTLNYAVNDSLGFNVEDMPTEGVKYYVLAADHKFHQVTKGFVDAERWALAVPDSVGETSPVIDLILETAGETADKRFPILNPFDLSQFTLVEDATAISAVAEEQKTMKQLFDLGGRMVATPRRGIMISDRKKVLVK